MIEIICSRSGLKFQAENRRKKVHPEISWYTSHKDCEIRYPAIEVIERGKAEGWDTLEKFEAEIQKALNPPPVARPDYNFEGAWCAKITGASEKFRFNREFLDAVDTEGRFKRFDFDTAGDGIIECCYKSAKGNESRYYYRYEGGKITELTLADVEALFPAIEKPAPVSTQGCETIEKFIGKPGETVLVDGSWVTVVKVEETHCWEDEDGIAGTGSHYGQGVYVVAEWTEFKTYYRPATESEIEVGQSAAAQSEIEKSNHQAAMDAIKFLKELRDKIEWEKPENPQPAGIKIGYRDKVLSYDSPYLQLDGNLLWSVRYNGRDGDLWDLNNYGTSIAVCREITPELVAKILEAAQEIKVVYPEAID